MNLRRGFFRLWLVFSVLFVIATAVVFFPDVKSEFEKAAEWSPPPGEWSPPPGDLLVPVECSADLRGKSGDDYEVLNYSDGRDRCWYEFPKFRVLYSEYKGLTDDELSDRLYKKAGIPTTTPRLYKKATPATPWTSVLKAVGIAIGVPLIVLALGSAIGWSFAGFSGEQLKKKA
jgi:hypothetical protein